MRDFLVEVHTEELPPKTLLPLAERFLYEVETRLAKAELKYEGAIFFATPRRLAVYVKKLALKQPDVTLERKGPAVSAAFDEEGNPTSACMGFARSAGVTPDQLIRIKNGEQEWVGYRQKIKGKKTQTLLPDIINQALLALPIPKRMRWGNQNEEFIRPLHSVVMIYGQSVISATILGMKTGKKTQGHRFHHPGWITISSPDHYEAILEKNHVIADFEKRKNNIKAQVKHKIKQKWGDDAEALMQEYLLQEVTGLVEWPEVLIGHFEETFLEVPQEVLISSMQDHQRYFPIVNKKGKLLPYFVIISNIQSKHPEEVIHGNERVLRARLSDASFFFMTDKKQTLEGRVELLKSMVFQEKLGTLHDKVERIASISALLATLFDVSASDAKKVSLLSKTDLTTQLVGEFPELQGIAGYYYALFEGLPPAIAEAIKEHYLPRFSGDQLPHSLLGCIVAIADRTDTLVGIFGIQHIPTGDKDPFGLRRASLAILRILIEKKLSLDLKELVKMGVQQFNGLFQKNTSLIENIVTFMMERLKPWYSEQGFSADEIASVSALDITNPYDFDCRLCAIHEFKKMPQAESLSSANKRVKNILSQYDGKLDAVKLNASLFEHDAERNLAHELNVLRGELSQESDYEHILRKLSALKEPVDLFFDKVLVMTDDAARRENRLVLLSELRQLFLYVADIALLQ